MVRHLQKLCNLSPCVELKSLQRMRLLKVQVPGPFELALKNGKASLLSYLDGHNYKQKKLSWKLPLFVTSKTEGWEVSSALPDDLELSEIPRPVDQRLKFEEVMEAQVAALNFLGKISYSSYIRHMDLVKNWSQEQQLRVVSPSRLILHDWNRSFSVMPKNEIILHLESPGELS